jgi:hypothetical protein
MLSSTCQQAITPRAAEQKRACAGALGRLRAGDPGPMAAWLRTHLFDHVLPFWERHAFDADGGLLTCVTDTGEIVARERGGHACAQATAADRHDHRVKLL